MKRVLVAAVRETLAAPTPAAYLSIPRQPKEATAQAKCSQKIP